jgi:hypothetical protein
VFAAIDCYLKDSNLHGASELGDCSIPIKSLVPDSPKDLWLPLDNASTGELHLIIQYCPFVVSFCPSSCCLCKPVASMCAPVLVLPWAGRRG